MPALLPCRRMIPLTLIACLAPGISLANTATPGDIDPASISAAVENLHLHLTIDTTRDLRRIRHSAQFRFRLRPDHPTDVFFFFPGVDGVEQLDHLVLNDSPLPLSSLREDRHPEYGTPIFILPANVFANCDLDAELRLSVGGMWFDNAETHYTRWGAWHPYLVSRLEPVPVTMDVNAGADLTVIGSGRKIGSRADGEGMTTWTWTSSRPVDWMFLTIGDYRRSTLSEDDLTLDVYWPAEHADFDPNGIGGTSFDILRYYSRRFGSSSVETVQLVEVPADAVNNIAVNGTIVITYGSWEAVQRNPRHLESTLAHEIAHCWWGDTVTPVGDGHRFLSESFAEYSRYLYERDHGIEPLPWSFRNGVMLSQFSGSEPPTIWGPPVYGDAETVYYQKGCFVLHMLERLVHPDVMSSVLSTWVGRYRSRRATIRDFIDEVERATGGDWEWFFDQWLRRPTGPRLSLDNITVESQGSRYRLRGEVRQDAVQPYRLEVLVRVTDDSGASVDRMLYVRDSVTPLDMLLEREPTAVLVDPEGDLFKWFGVSDLPISFADANAALSGGVEVGAVGMAEFFHGPEQARMFHDWFQARFPASNIVPDESLPFRFLFGARAADFRTKRRLRIPTAKPGALAVYIARGESFPGGIVVGVEGSAPDTWPELLPDGPYWFVQLEDGNYTQVFGTALPSVRWDAP